VTFISYAQNYEDVILHRALKHIDKGFYIDVGANDPIIDSVTKAFYDIGWRGINIEPVSEWFKKLQQNRPEDINLQLAVGARKSEVNFFELVGTGLSTMDKSIAKRHEKEHDFEIIEYKILAVRLTTICEQHPHTDIHFLKIDVEGTELSVLQGLDLKKIRPWIIVVESTLPNSQEENYEEWEYSLTKRGYHYVYFDGLNRYYVADEHEELDNAFTAPPNYFDFFKRESEDRIEKENQKLEIEQDAAKINFQQLEKHAKQVEANLADSHHQYQRLETHTNSLKEEINQTSSKLYEKESKLQELMLSQQEILLAQMEKETQIQENITTITENKKTIENLQSSFADSKKQNKLLQVSFADSEQEYQQLEVQTQNLHEEIDRSDKLLNEKDKKIDFLNKEQETTKQKIDELNQSSHHWWLESERLNKELQSVYQSKPWKISLFLKNLVQLFKRGYQFMKCQLIWVIQLPKRAVRWLLVKVMSFVIKRPKIRASGMKLLRAHPKLEGKLRQLANAQNLGAVQTIDIENSHNIGNEAIIDTSHLTPRARLILGEIKTAIEQNKQMAK